MGFFSFRKNKKNKEITQLKNALYEFRRPLVEIKNLSERLNYPGFTKIFEESLTILDSNLNDQDKAKRLIKKTQILGGMGSWGDSPPCTAHQLGISSEFEEITKHFSISRSSLETNYYDYTKTIDRKKHSNEN